VRESDTLAPLQPYARRPPRHRGVQRAYLWRRHTQHRAPV